MRLIKLTTLACAAAGIVAATSAHALTYDTHSYRNADGSSKFQDPDDALKGGDDKDSGFSMKFSGGSDQSSSGGSSDRLFLPQSGAAANPYSGSSNFDTALGDNRRW